MQRTGVFSVVLVAFALFGGFAHFGEAAAAPAVKDVQDKTFPTKTAWTAAPTCCAGCNYGDSPCCCGRRIMVPLTKTKVVVPSIITVTVTGFPATKKANVRRQASGTFAAAAPRKHAKRVALDAASGSRHVCPACPAGVINPWGKTNGNVMKAYCCPARKTVYRTITKRTKTVTKTVLPTVTPTMNPANRIVDPNCRYVPVPYVLTSPNASAYTISSSSPAWLKPSVDDRYFIEAAQTWMSVISGDLDDFANQVANCIYDTNTTKPILDCVHVDDLIIGFKVTAIDRLGNQFGNTLGSASYGVLRGTGFTNGNSLPVTGYMRFDEADFDQMEKMGYLQAVILHEMGHILGIGSLWHHPYFSQNVLSSPTCMPALSVNRSSNVQFIGQQTLAKLPLINPPVGMKAPAIQNGTKKGTACSHWHEDIFTTELMTGYATESSTGNELSVMTAASLKDLGYPIDFNSPMIQPFDMQRARSRSQRLIPLEGCVDPAQLARAKVINKDGTVSNV